MPELSLVVHCNELCEVLIAVLCLFLVQLEQDIGTSRELTCESAVAGLVHQELLISACRSLGVE